MWTCMYMVVLLVLGSVKNFTVSWKHFVEYQSINLLYDASLLKIFYCKEVMLLLVAI